MTYNQIQELFNHRYIQENFKQFLGETFANALLLPSPEILPGIDTNVASGAQKLGYIMLNENGIDRQIAVYEVTLAQGIILERNRIGLRNILRKYWKDIDAAFITFHHPEDTNWRFTYVSELTGYDADGEFIRIKTEPKRYTYVLGEGESTRTAAERFLILANKGRKATLDDVKEAFSVEKLSKSFFEEYKRHYDIFCELMISKPGIRQAVFGGNEKGIRDFNKKLLGRIVFLYFIQKKGWLGVAINGEWGKGDFNFLTNLFRNTNNPGLFYSELLSKLFFDTLNTKRTNDLIELVKGEPCRIPYLNGGLFEEDDIRHRGLILPASLFQNLFDFFNQYNFTIYEDDPNDHTVAVDPEMLGHIFENLLEDNKDKGAFYTPKEIVHYMCQESLIEYLTTWFENKGYEVVGYVGINNPDQPELFSIDEGRKGQLVLETVKQAKGKQIDRILIEKLLKKKLDDDDKKLVLEHASEFGKALDSVKICDPAIGSGAFPMGLLHEIFTAKQTLWQFDNGNLIHFPASDIKMNIIQNSIYGVDIEKGAVDIARLRFWLSLIVDEPEPKALPNLDYKIVVGNSLVSKFGEDIIDIDWSLDETVYGIFGAELAKEKSALLNKISQKQKEFFSPESDKKKLTTEIRNLKINLLINQLQLMIKKQEIQSEPKKADYGNKPAKKFIEDCNKYLQCIGWQKHITNLKKLKEQTEVPLNFFDWKLDFPEVMNPYLFESTNSPQIAIANAQIIALNAQIDAINLHLKKHDVDAHLIHLQANVAQSQIAIILQQMLEIEKEIKAIYGLITNVKGNVVQEPDLSFAYKVKSINKSISQINQQIDFLNPKIENQNTNIGFDIVIGNPPYLSISKLPEKNILQNKGYKTFENTGDIYSLFYELGNNLLRIKGCLTFITSRQWINSGYGKSTRKYFCEETNPLVLIDFGKAKLFQAATVFVNILMFEKSKNLNILKACLFPDDYKIDQTDLGSYFSKNNIILSSISETVWKIGAASNEFINKKLEQKGEKLKEWKDISFYAGIKTAFNPAFHINEATKNELIAKDPKNANIIKPLLRGKDIKRYGYKFEKIYLLNTHNGIRDINLEPIKVAKDYPIIFEHLQQYEKELKNRDDQGLHWSNLRNCAFLNEFEKEKIVWIEISDRANFTYDTNGMYLTNSAYFMSGVCLKYILAVINSKVSDFYFSQITAKIAGGRMRYTKQYVEQIPIPRIESNAQKPFEILADNILILKSSGKDTSVLERQIDNMVYKLYELTYEEVKVIDPEFGLSVEEYEMVNLY